jgi:hypothetical protein
VDSVDFERFAEALRNLVAEKPETRLIGARKLMQADQATFAPIIVPALVGLVGNPDSVISRGTLRIFGKLGPAAGRAGEEIFQLVKKDGPESKEAVDALRSILKLVNIDKNTIIGYDDYQSFLKHLSASNRLPETPEDEKRPEFLAAILGAAPKGAGYAELAQNLEGLNHDFRREMAARLEPALNAHVQAMPHDTYDEKRILVKWVNDELRRFDLAVKCPKTGSSGLLHADPGNHPEIGRFQIEIKGDDGKRRRTVNSPELFHLELMNAPPRREALAEWHGKVRRHGGDAGRA